MLRNKTTVKRSKNPPYRATSQHLQPFYVFFWSLYSNNLLRFRDAVIRHGETSFSCPDDLSQFIPRIKKLAVCYHSCKVSLRTADLHLDSVTLGSGTLQHVYRLYT